MMADKGRKPGSVAKSAREWVPVFLEALKAMPVVRLACEHAGVSRKTAYQWRDQNEEFRAEWRSALEDGIDMIEAQLHARARTSSDRAAMFLLRSLRREVYGDHVAVDVKAHLTLDEVAKAKASLEEKLARLMAPEGDH
tara:strand:+ start:1184 stop:1600 length:417 start_codon:yes stop_codon:yes gene_type:complete